MVWGSFPGKGENARWPRGHRAFSFWRTKERKEESAIGTIRAGRAVLMDSFTITRKYEQAVKNLKRNCKSGSASNNIRPAGDPTGRILLFEEREKRRIRCVKRFGLLSAPLGEFLGPAGLVPFDIFSLVRNFEWIMNESKTNFELYIKPRIAGHRSCRYLESE